MKYGIIACVLIAVLKLQLQPEVANDNANDNDNILSWPIIVYLEYKLCLILLSAVSPVK